ncbi:MAG: Gfo/Idh/MocA family oxidoreductase [Planctomycetales bacterium]|nr:Gfo/Idh/MocA family oxidoreductase [Planctomycetales bacterium]
MLRTLIVGVGSIGERHLRCFAQTQRTELAICDANTSLLERIQHTCCVTSAYANLDAAWHDRFDLVVIATPAHLHLSMAIAAVRQGSHVLIEKPLCVSASDLQLLQAEAIRAERHVMVGYVLRHHPLLEWMKQRMQNGEFGRPLHLQVASGQHFPTYRPAYQSIYYAQHATGGGAIQDGLTHLLDLAQWLIGPVDQLVADASHQQLEGVSVEDTVNVISRHGSSLASFAFNQYQAPNETSLTCVCERGTWRWDHHLNLLAWKFDPAEPWQRRTEEDLQRDALFVRQANAALNVVTRQASPRCSLDEAYQDWRVAMAIFESMQRRSWVRVAEIEPSYKPLWN